MFNSHVTANGRRQAVCDPLRWFPIQVELPWHKSPNILPNAYPSLSAPASPGLRDGRNAGTKPYMPAETLSLTCVRPYATCRENRPWCF
jgi:hypothetical protein